MMVDSLSLSTMTIKSGLSLPEDVLLDIFRRLPIKSICKFKCLSKVWLSNLSGTDFMRSKFKTIEKIKPWEILSDNLMSTQFTSSCEELCGDDGFFFNFLAKSYSIDAENDELCILSSSNGLVLCSAVHDCTVRYFVCNPITKESVSLPPPPSGAGEFSCGLICDTYSDSPASNSAFKVVRTQKSLRSNTGFVVEIYHSDLDEWRTYNVAYLQPRQLSWEEEQDGGSVWEEEFKINNVITHNGVVYWIEKHETNRVVAYDLKINNYECESHQCDIAFDVPVLHKHRGRQPASSECLGVFADSVFYAHIRKNVLRAWVLKLDYEPMKEDGHYGFIYDFCNSKSVWRIRHEIHLPADDDEDEEYTLMGFSPINCDVVILACCDGDEIVLGDMAAKTLKKCPSVPHGENSFMTQPGCSPIVVTPTLTTISKARRKISNGTD